MQDAAMPRRWLPLLLCCTAALALPFTSPEEKDSEESRRVLGSSVVTSVSVIMDLGNGTKKYFADAAGRPVSKPTAAAMVGSPAGLLNPDRYEFYTFDEAGDLIKRLMSLEEIQSIIANGETELGEAGFPNYYHQNLPLDSIEFAPSASSTVTDKVVEEAEATNIGELSSVVPGVHDVVVSVQNVLKGELEASKNKIPSPKPVPSLQTPMTVAPSDSSLSWGVILPGIINNTSIVPVVASQSTYSSSSPIINTTQKLGNTSTGTPSHVTENIPLTTTQKYKNSSEASTNHKPLLPVSSDIAHVDQPASNSVNVQSKLPSLHSSPTSHVPTLLPLSSSSYSSSSSSSSSPMLSTTKSPTTQSSASSSAQFVLYSSSPKPSYLSHSSTKLSSTTLPSILTSLSVSSETPHPQSSSLPTLLPSKPSASPTVSTTPPYRPQPPSLTNSYSSVVETVTNPPLKDSLSVNKNKPFSQNGSFSKPIIGDNHITTATTQKPIFTSHLSSSTSKISSASLGVGTESVDVSATSSVTQQPLTSLTKPSKIPVNNVISTLSQKVVSMSTVPYQTPSSHVERTTTPTNSAISTASSIGNNSIILEHENSEILEPAMVMISSSESSTHGNISSSQEFLNFFTSASNISSTTHPLPTEYVQPSNTTYRPSTGIDHNKKPARPVQSTPTIVDITKIRTQSPHTSSSSIQTSTANPLETKTSLAVINNKNDGLSTEEFIKTNAQNINLITTTTTEVPLSSSTWKNNDESLLINEASGFVPVKIESPVGAIPLPTLANENLDMPPELAESVLGVLSQVADVEGAVTTIDYGESGLYVFSLSTTGTKHSVTEGISSTESSIYSSPNSTANGIPQTNITLLHNGLMTESINTDHSSPTNENLSATTLHSEATQQNAVTKQSIRETPTPQELSNLHLKETTGDQTKVLLSMEHASSVYEQNMLESTTIETEYEQKQNYIEFKQGGNENDMDVEGINKEKDKVTNSEDQSKVSKVNIVHNTSVELLSSANNNNNNEPLKTSFEIIKTDPNAEETVTVSGDNDSDFVSNTKTTFEAVDDVTTGNDGTELRESTVYSFTELTTEQPSPNTHRSNIKNEVNVEGASILDVEETSIGTDTDELYNTATTIIPETTSLRDMIESSIQTTKENIEIATVTLTKYKKDDTEMAEESMQHNLTMKPDDDLMADKINTDNKSSVQEHEYYDDKETFSTEREESTTQMENGTTEDPRQTEELNIPIQTTTNAELIQRTETRTDTIITDKNDGIHINEATVNMNLTENELTTELPTEGNIKDAVGHKTESLDTVHEMTAEDITTEVTSRYETEFTTVHIEFTSDSGENTSFQDEEPKATTNTPVTQDKGSETTIASPETKIESYFMETSLEKGSEVSEKDVHHWESNVTNSTDSPEKETKFGITKTTVDNTSWTKHSTAPPSQVNDDEIRDKTAFGSTSRPATIISVITTTESATAPIGMLKVSGLNEEKLKDTKIKANPQEFQLPQTHTTVELQPAPQENLGLEASSVGLDEDVRHFAELCNELAFRLWAAVTTKGLMMSRSVVMSPFAVTSLLAMVFLGARGPTSGQMNDILRLDDMVTFNPHQVFRNITESLVISRTQGIATAVFIRQLYSDRTKGKLLDFYKERAQQFYDGHVEEVNFNAIGDLVRRRTNLLIKRQTHGRVLDYLRSSNILLRPPLAVFSANIFQTDCSQASIYGRDGEMYFTVMPAMRQRRLVPVPAVVWFSGFLAGYEPVLDATAASIGSDNSLISLVMVLPGQQGQQAPGDGLQRLEQRLIETSYRHGAWSRLLRSLLPRPGLEVQIPRFSHRSLLNVTLPLQRMGLKDLFSAEHADLRGINGLANNLHLSDIIQVNTFSTCSEENVSSRHHVEVYPTSPQRSGREELNENLEKGSVHFDDMDDLEFSSLPLALRPRQARLPNAPRLRFDRPFLYFVRHNPTGLILHMGRFNPRLLH